MTAYLRLFYLTTIIVVTSIEIAFPQSDANENNLRSVIVGNKNAMNFFADTVRIGEEFLQTFTTKRTRNKQNLIHDLGDKQKVWSFIRDNFRGNDFIIVREKENLPDEFNGSTFYKIQSNQKTILLGFNEGKLIYINRIVYPMPADAPKTNKWH